MCLGYPIVPTKLLSSPFNGMTWQKGKSNKTTNTRKLK
jgi:hypothetical protein